MVAKSFTAQSDRVVEVTRVFDAPRSLVFKAWTDPEQRAQWWGPNGFKVSFCEMDPRVGGAWRMRMGSAEIREVRQSGVFREIVEPERLVFTYAFEDESGKRGHETIVTLTFADQGGKTLLTLHQAFFEDEVVRGDHVRGWTQSLNRLVDYAKEATA